MGEERATDAICELVAGDVTGKYAFDEGGRNFP